MGTEIDGFALLKKIGDHPDVFRHVKAAVTKTSYDLVVKQAKLKTTGLPELRSIRDVVGKEQFGLLLDGLNDASVKSILTRLDKYHPDLKNSDGRWKRDRLRELCLGLAEPAERVKAPKSSKRASSRKEVEHPDNPSGLGSETLKAFRETLKRK
jgi:hypothetical protein